MIRFARGLWGMPGADMEIDCATIAKAGYTVVEAHLDADAQRAAALAAACANQGLDWVAQIHTRRQHLSDAISRLQTVWHLAHAYGAVLVNLHTGSDLASDSFNDALIHAAAELSSASGLRCVHETHRGRCTYSLPAIERLLKMHPALRFCADLSHWVCVHESLLTDAAPILEQVLSRSDLIHARVGHPQGSQVADWRDPLVAATWQAHLFWWDQVVAGARASDRDIIIGPEFGPAPYQPCLPWTGEPLSDGWEVNHSLALFLRKRYV